MDITERKWVAEIGFVNTAIKREKPPIITAFIELGPQSLQRAQQWIIVSQKQPLPWHCTSRAHSLALHNFHTRFQSNQQQLDERLAWSSPLDISVNIYFCSFSVSLKRAMPFKSLWLNYSERCWDSVMSEIHSWWNISPPQTPFLTENTVKWGYNWRTSLFSLAIFHLAGEGTWKI